MFNIKQFWNIQEVIPAGLDIERSELDTDLVKVVVKITQGRRKVGRVKTKA